MKKIISMLTLLCIMVCTFCTSVSAESADVSTEAVQPRYTYATSVITNWTKSGSKIKYSCVVGAKSSVTKISVYLHIQVYENNKWQDADLIFKRTETNSNVVSATLDKPVKGKKYRTFATVFVYENLKYEKIEKIGNTGTFS